MHVHIGLILGITSFLNVIIIGTFWRLISMKFHDTALGQAMAFMY